MLVLITQIVWAANAYAQNKKELKAKVNTALDLTAKKTLNRAACFEVFSKAYLKKGDNFYMAKFGPDKKTDTIPMLFTGRGFFYDESAAKFLEKHNYLDFTRFPTSAEIVINFMYHVRDTGFSKISQDSVFDRLSPTNYQEVFAGNADVTSLYETRFIDSTLHAELLKQDLDQAFTFGIIESAAKKVAYKNRALPDSLLLHSAYVNDLNKEGYFSRHYQLSLVFDKNTIVGKNLWWMLSASAFVVLLLIALIARFIRVILHQRRLNEMKNDFINNLTHEFNTPVSNIALAAESLGKNDTLQQDEKVARLIGIIHEQNENIRGNVEHILKIAANEKRGMQLNKEKLNVAELVKSVIHAFEFVLREKAGHIHFNPPTEPLYVEGDELYLLHAIQNIIDNAIKYTRNKPEIHISLAVEKGLVMLSFSDNGIGMSREEVKYIFDKFYRVPTGNVHHSRGFGLGLNYVLSIVKAHQGQISVSSRTGKGSVFEIYFPQKNGS